MTFPNIPSVVKQIANQQDGEQLFVATVTSLVGALVTVTRLGSFSPMTMPLACLTSYSSRAVGDQVLVGQISGAYWVLGKIGPEIQTGATNFKLIGSIEPPFPFPLDDGTVNGKVVATIPLSEYVDIGDMVYVSFGIDTWAFPSSPTWSAALGAFTYDSAIDPTGANPNLVVVPDTVKSRGILYFDNLGTGTFSSVGMTGFFILPCRDFNFFMTQGSFAIGKGGGSDDQFPTATLVSSDTWPAVTNQKYNTIAITERISPTDGQLFGGLMQVWKIAGTPE